ncbi:hypothetical protein Q5P01_001005 [Channa striata]|uniref:Uncharacterized protein n=1 Tax=Channa striata TaxID=64152 RepID=A0AA88IHM4_CHASR|nr:hypothetical protein Q5P01_001005 [Channa striata]
MDDPVPFVNLFPDIYPKRRAVPYLEEGSIGVLIKSVMFHRNEEALLCRGLVLHARDGDRIYDTVCFKVVDITPVVGYDLDLARDQGDVEESWSQKANGTLSPCELVSRPREVGGRGQALRYHAGSALLQGACLDIETVVDESFGTRP